MTPLPPYQPGQSVTDYVVSVIRTVVPVLWGTLITYLVTLIPAVAQVIDPAAVIGWGPAVAGFLTAVWYVIMRKIEPALPAWLTVIVLGSNTAPKYLAPNQVVVPAGLQVPPDPRASGRAD